MNACIPHPLKKTSVLLQIYCYVWMFRPYVIITSEVIRSFKCKLLNAFQVSRPIEVHKHKICNENRTM